MPFVGIGLHLALALCCAVHAVRSGQQTYWLFILFSFPLLGSVVYLLTIYLPHSRLHRQANRTLRAVGRVLDPGRELREARAALEDTPTAQNQMRLAAALLGADQLEEAAATYEQCLQGPFANDADVRWGAAQVQLQRGRADLCLTHLAVIADRQPDFRAEAVALLRARALAQQGRHDEAGTLFSATVARFGSFEAKAERLLWAWSQHQPQADTWRAELEQQQRKWNAHTRELNAPLLARLREAQPKA